jgi:hypothetical protein
MTMGKLYNDPSFQNGKIWIKNLNIGPTIPLEQELSLCFVLNSTLIRQRFPLFSLQGMPKKVSCGASEY